MHVDVKLFSRLREHLPPQARGEATIELPPEATVGQLLEHLGVGTRIRLISINGEREEDRSRVLHEGDSVRVFPIVHGG
jgi:molybdopterin converting factor small subunit